MTEGQNELAEGGGPTSSDDDEGTINKMFMG